MAANRIVTSERPTIVIEWVEGDLSLRGWPRAEIVIASDPREIEYQQEGDTVRLRVRDDASIQLPAGAQLHIEQISGDVALNGVTGAVEISVIEGDASLRDVGPLRVGQVEGDLSVRGVRGDCSVGQVQGDASISRVDGAVTVDSVEDDLVISSVGGAVRAAAGEDVALALNPVPGCTYDVRAGNDITCRLPAGASVRINLTAGDEINVHGLSAPLPQGGNVTFQVGAGEAALTLVAGDDINLRGGEGWNFGDVEIEFGPEFGARMADFAQQIETQVNAVVRQVEEKINNMGGTEEVATKIQERILAAARKAEEKITEVIRTAEARAREAEQRQREAEQRQRTRTNWPPPPTPPAPPKPPKPPRAPVSEDERLLILRMVSEGKISVEQAEKLLAALNGPGSGD